MMETVSFLWQKFFTLQSREGVAADVSKLQMQKFNLEKRKMIV